jgi:thiol-disulfide isomerase/thioredoxin
MKRRGLIVGGIGVAAAAAGVGFSVVRTRNAHDPEAALWGMSFEQPGGGTLALAGMRGRPTLLNFWATWCPPCVKEMPLLDAFYRAHQVRGWQVVGLAVDQAAPVTDYLRRLPMSFPIGLAGSQGVALSRSLGNASGGLPFSVVFDADGAVSAHKLGAVTAEELADWDKRFGRAA